MMKAKISLFFALGIVMTVTVLTACGESNGDGNGDLLPALALSSPSGASCSTKSDCAAGQYCLDKICQNYQCSKNAHCNANEICSNNKCVIVIASACEDVGGYCHAAANACMPTYFAWSSCGCSGGASIGCCLPEGTCQGIGGACVGTADPCPAGYSDATSLVKDPDTNCKKCCIPN
jgi:hypothetical protein